MLATLAVKCVTRAAETLVQVVEWADPDSKKRPIVFGGGRLKYEQESLLKVVFWTFCGIVYSLLKAETRESGS